MSFARNSLFPTIRLASVILLAVLALEARAQAGELLRISVRDSAISLVNDFNQMRQSVESKYNGQSWQVPMGADSYVECAPIQEVKETFLCIFNFQKFMNASLLRASYYIEEEKIILNHWKFVSHREMRTVEGHDLQGPALLQYSEEFRKAEPLLAPLPVNDPISADLLAIEKDFWQDFLLPKLKISPHLVLLAVSLDTDYESTISHEILHAQYFQTPEFQSAIREFWRNSVPDQKRKAIRQALSRYYDVGNEELVINEFQAYMLMKGAEGSELKQFVPEFRQVILTELQGRGIAPIQFQPR